MDVRADLLWQLNMPTMQWCGAAVAHSAREPTSFSLRVSSQAISQLLVIPKSSPERLRVTRSIGRHQRRFPLP